MNLPTLLADWPFQPAVIAGIGITGFLYWRGVRYATSHGLARYHRWWHSLSFGCGLVVTLLALDSPIDSLVSQFFWIHMVQHELLILLAAPLLLFGEPAMLLWRAVPLGTRRATLLWALRQGWPRRVWDGVAHILGMPRVAWTLFLVVFLTWHLPALYDFALHNQAVHITEHVSFLGVALIFWAQVIPSRPLRLHMSYFQQAFYVGTSAMLMNGLAAVYMYSTSPMYPYYAALPRSIGEISALTDQHIAGAVMDVPGTILFALAICALLVLWLREDERAPASIDTQPYAGFGRWGDEMIAASASAVDGGADGARGEEGTDARREEQLVHIVAASPGSRKP
jgi:putative membrane protein